jgi:hypothetical protein
MRLRENELIERFQLRQIISEYLDKFDVLSINVPLLEYYAPEEHLRILNIKKTKEGKFLYSLPEPSKIESFAKEVHSKFDEIRQKRTDPVEIRINIETWIRDALLRCGLCEHGNLERDVMRFIKSYDDIILAPDTNILLNCVITSILLPKINEKINEEIKGCPNWILIAIPKLVMNEVERWATRRFSAEEFLPKAGWPKYEGRIGQRALQEILELDTNIDFKGVSIMTIGEIPPTYDSFKNDPARWDSEIRFQVRDFISKISFHKGAFFITQDRINAMMARAEGLQALFLQKPEYVELVKKYLVSEDPSSVLYELAVSFGEIEIEKIGKFSVFWPEKHVDDWEKSRLMVTQLYS